MRLSFTDYELDIIKKSLGGNIMANGILSKVKSGENSQEEQKQCNHKFGEYRGQKTCCVYCESVDIGMEEDWKLNKIL